jgi:ribosome-associated heat shock protein Hsp15
LIIVIKRCNQCKLPVSFNLQIIMEKLRLDKYLWAIRLFKTRTQATSAIDDGKVKWNSANVKPSRLVALGDRYSIKTPDRKWTIEVIGLLHNRAGYEEAIKHYADLTSDEDKELNRHEGSSFYTGKRQSKTGHPTKKERRDLEDFLSDGPEGE